MKRIIISRRGLTIIATLLFMLPLSFQVLFYNKKAEALVPNPDEVVTYLAKERNVSVEEAEIRIGWQEKAGALSDKLRQLIPEVDYGGVWINKTDDRINVGLADGSNTADSSRQKIISEINSFGVSEGADIVSVKYSQASLQKVTDSIYKLYKGNVRREDWPIQVGIKTDLNKVEVDIPEDGKNLTEGHRFVISEIDSRYKDQVFIERYDELPEDQAECNWWFCNSPLRGGVGIKGNYQDFSQIDCTAGFIVRGSETGNFYVLTAGHCRSAGYGWEQKPTITQPN